MKFAVLRGLFFGVVAAPCGFVLGEAMILAAILLDGPLQTQADDELHLVSIAYAAMLGIGLGVVGYATHPSSKRLPKHVTDKLGTWADRFVPRIIVGSSFGWFAGFAVFYCGVGVCQMFALDPHQHIWNWPQSNGTEIVARFVVDGASGAAFAAALLGTLMVPPAREPNFVKPAVWNAILGAVAGTWLCSGAGLVVLNLVKWHYVDLADDHATLLAIGAGLAAGTAAAIVLRVWRNR